MPARTKSSLTFLASAEITVATNLLRSDEGKEAALERRHMEAAEQIVTALGTMKGAAMKIGQVLSFVDTGMIPPEYRDEFQEKLGALRDAAPTVAFPEMQKVLEDELEAPLTEVFEEFDDLDLYVPESAPVH